MDTVALLTKWRHLIEPETGTGLNPVAWEDVLKMKLRVFEGESSVVVARLVQMGGVRTLSIWVAAGQLNEVMDLVDQAEAYAVEQRCRQVVFVGRRGWIRAANGYSDVATIGVKELSWAS